MWFCFDLDRFDFRKFKFINMQVRNIGVYIGIDFISMSWFVFLEKDVFG